MHAAKSHWSKTWADWRHVSAEHTSAVKLRLIFIKYRYLFVVFSFCSNFILVSLTSRSWIVIYRLRERIKINIHGDCIKISIYFHLICKLTAHARNSSQAFGNKYILCGTNKIRVSMLTYPNLDITPQKNWHEVKTAKEIAWKSTYRVESELDEWLDEVEMFSNLAPDEMWANRQQRPPHVPDDHVSPGKTPYRVPSITTLVSANLYILVLGIYFMYGSIIGFSTLAQIWCTKNFCEFDLSRKCAYIAIKLTILYHQQSWKGLTGKFTFRNRFL